MKNQRILGLILLLFICYFPLFLHLDTLSLRLWDESRRGVNAIEMATEGHWLVPHFEGHPDNYGTKPPFLVWTQAIGMKLFGFNELAVRLPSALAGLATVFLLWLFARQVLERPISGFFAGLVLVTSHLYIDKHAAVSGDYDALLTLFQTFYLLCFYLFLKKEQIRFLYLTALGVLLAGWTKGIAGMFFLPALVLFVFLEKKAKFVFQNKQVYLTAFLTLAGVLSYYFIRDWIHPGYLEIVWGNELGGRFFEAREGYQRPFWFYLNFLFKHQSFHPWLFLVPVGFAFGLKQKKIKSFSLLVLANALIFFLVISNSKTKFEWYILPLLPLLSLIVGIALEEIYQKLSGFLKLSSRWHLVGLSIFTLAVFILPYNKIIQKVYVFEHQGYELDKVFYADFMKRNSDIKEYTILHPSYNGHIVFYKKLYNRKGFSIQQKIMNPPRPQVQVIPKNIEVQEGNQVMVCEKQAQQYLEENFQIEKISEWKTCRMYKIGKKEF